MTKPGLFSNRNGMSSLKVSTFSALCAFSIQVYSDPIVTEVAITDGELKHGGTLAVRGAGFGSKEQAAPVFLDYIEEVYENGKLRQVYSDYADGQAIKPASENPDSLWGAVTGGSSVRYDRSSPQRHRYDVARYHLIGENSWLGRPVVYGGPGGWDTPIDNPQLYLSWWVKVDYNSAYYWRFNPHDISGDFSPGESVSSDADVSGIFIGVDKEGLLNFQFDGHRNATGLKNVTIIGERSGAKTRFPEEFRGGSGYGYETPGTKQLRIWDDPDSQGIRTSLSQADYFLASHSNQNYSSNRIYQLRDMKRHVWHHFEAEIDVRKGTYKSWFNGEMGGVAEFDPRAAYEGKYSPTIALIGNNAKQDHLQNMYISEIYMDKSVQRAVIGNAAHYSDLNHYELQRPVTWTDDSLELVVNLGALDLTQDIYLYIFDENGIPNESGISLCSGADCPSPPKSIQLQIQK